MSDRLVGIDPPSPLNKGGLELEGFRGCWDC